MPSNNIPSYLDLWQRNYDQEAAQSSALASPRQQKRSINIAHVYQPGIGLPDSGYFSKQIHLRSAFNKPAKDIFARCFTLIIRYSWPGAIANSVEIPFGGKTLKNQFCVE
jgi:hypothetical protein